MASPWQPTLLGCARGLPCGQTWAGLLGQNSPGEASKQAWAPLFGMVLSHVFLFYHCADFSLSTDQRQGVPRNPPKLQENAKSMRGEGGGRHVRLRC